MQKDRTWVEVSKKALLHNYKVFRNLTRKNTKLALVVKSNAYGHGMIQVAKVFANRADFFAVDEITEALELRKAGINKPVLVLGYTLPVYYKKASRENISITISSLHQLERLASKDIETKIHIKVDTGLHRQGMSISEFRKALRVIDESKIELEGVYSHFASAENLDSKLDQKYCLRQIKLVKKVKDVIKDKKIRPKPILHMSGSAASLGYKDAEMDMVRLGISLYGLWPSESTRDKMIGKSQLSPALTWKSVISEVKNVKKGSYVGYDLTEKVERDSKVAVVPVGYWHGYRWAFSGKSYVLIKGVKVKVLGRVSMDMCVVDVTDIRVRVGDEVVLLGRSSDRSVSAEELAQIAGTINYEIVTCINPLIKRVIK